MKISENFSLHEFVQDGRDITPVQFFMLQNLCIKILEPIRAFLNSPIVINSGMRFPSDINRLRKAGYNPSETSDHLYGNVIKVTSLKKKVKFGNYYSFSVGAADIVPLCGAYTAWEDLKPYFNPVDRTIDLPIRNNILKLKIGQFILEKKTSYWIHVSNPASLIYSEKFNKKFLNRTPFLTSTDNGKSYNIYKE